MRKMTSLFTDVAYAAWAVLVLVWIPGYFSQMRSSRISKPALQLATSALITFGVVLLLSRRWPRFLEGRITSPQPWLGAFGDAVCIAATLFP